MKPKRSIRPKTNEITKIHTNKKADSASCAWMSFFLLMYVFLPAFVLSVFLLLRKGSPALAYWCSLVLLLGLLLYARNKIGTVRCLIIGCLCFLLIVISSHAISWRFLDIFHDGMAYHQPATSRIAAGFNPVYDGYMEFASPRSNWSDQATYFPKATWYFAASVKAIFGDIQFGKAYHLILFFAALFFILHHTKGERIMKRLLWVSACLNPLVFYQCTGYVVDGALGSLSIISLFYASLHFSGRDKPVPLDAHVIGIVSLAMMFCVKTSGFAYGSIIVFCICLANLFTEFRVSKNPWNIAFIKTVKLGMKIGLPLLLLVTLLGFSPYITNLIEGKHIFYPLISSGQPVESDVSTTLETLANKAYPDAHNRVTRLLRSIASYPTYPHEDASQISPAKLKNPITTSLSEWNMYGTGNDYIASGMGPLFFLLMLISFPFALFFRGKENGWLLFTLLLMLFIQPYAWYSRYVPFIWALPFVFCLSTPRRWDYVLIAPVLLAIINTGGVAYVSTKNAADVTQEYIVRMTPLRGKLILIDKTLLWNYGITDRFGVKIDFKEDIPPLPDMPVVFMESAQSAPWTRMSEGVALYDPDKEKTVNRVSLLPKGYWNNSGEVKFFMKLTEKPVSDMTFALTASLRKEEGATKPQKMSVHVNNRPIGEWEWTQHEPEEKTVTIPLEVLELSFNDPMKLLGLTFYLSDAETHAAQEFSLMFEKMEFRAPVF